MTDEELMQAVAMDGSSGDRAFHELHKKYGARIRGQVRNYFRGKSDRVDDSTINDVVQEVWIKIFRNAGKYKLDKSKKKPLSHWLARLTSRICIDFDRKNKRDCRLAEGGQEKVKLPTPHSLIKSDGSEDIGSMRNDARNYLDVSESSPEEEEYYRETLKLYEERSPECYRLIREIATANLEPKDYKDFLNKSAGAARQFAYYCKKLLESMIYGDPADEMAR